LSGILNQGGVHAGVATSINRKTLQSYGKTQHRGENHPLGARSVGDDKIRIHS
jgi:hypothetical protein